MLMGVIASQTLLQAAGGILAGVGSSAGIGTALAAGSALTSGEGVGAATGIGAATATAAAIHAATGAAVGSGLATGSSVELDPSFASVVLLVGPTGADASTTITDESSTAKGNATVTGNAQIDTGTVKFTASMQFDGTGDQLHWADSLDWRLSTNNTDPFTVEAWVRFATVPLESDTIAAQRPTGGADLGWHLLKTSANKLGWASSADGSTFNVNISGTTTLVANTWFDTAVDKDASNKIRLYLDGVMEASTTPASGAINNSTQPMSVGARVNGGTDPMNGFIEELRITKGVARYASDSGFTPPTTRFPRG